MPTIPTIKTSIENKDVLVLDEHVKNGIFRRDARGRLMSYAGGFSVVFPYQAVNGENWAFRCWHSDVSNSQKRYEIISEAIKIAHLDFLTEFFYVEKGINVEGEIYPTTRMRWVDGVTIKDYICQNKNSRDLLMKLADNFLQMTKTLHKLGFAHGDLPHGNIMVSDDHQLHLVDYDSFYCPKLKGETDNITGLPDYQHPARKINKSVSEKLDYFSELIIYLCIRAIAEDQSLIEKYNVEKPDRLLFAKEGYENIKDSEIYKDISDLGVEFQEMLGILELYLQMNDINELSPFDELLLKNKIVFTSSAIKAVRDKQTIELYWKVPFEAEVSLLQNNGDSSLSNEQEGNHFFVLSNDTTFTLSVSTKDGRVFKKQISILVFDECEIDFSADKYYIFPTIPVKLSWKVRNSKKVWLDKEEVGAIGSKVIEPKKAVSVILSTEDEFGVKEKSIDIGMLPIPQIKTLLVPTPEIVNNMALTIQQPKYNVDVRFPTIDIDWVKVEVPRVPSLTELGLNIELSPPLPKFSIVSSIKRMFNHIIAK